MTRQRITTTRTTAANRPVHPARWIAGAAALALTLAGSTPARAQGSGKGFLFEEPIATIALRGGFARANAGSDIFSFATNQLTLSRGDFSGLNLGGDLSIRLTPRFDLSFGAEYAGTSKKSEFRKFEDQDGQPIEQTTNFVRVPVTASIKAYLTPRGRSIGRFAWIPAKYSAYVGGGGGAMWYRFRQNGDFVDFNTNNVFHQEFNSSKWTPTAHALAGIEYSLSSHFGLLGEGRYQWAKSDLSEDFSGFHKIDLSGVAATLGVYVRF